MNVVQRHGHPSVPPAVRDGERRPAQTSVSEGRGPGQCRHQPAPLRLKGQLKQEATGPWWIRTVAGDPEQYNLVVDEWFAEQGYSTKDYEFHLIYINGGNNLEKLKAPDDTWKVRLIEGNFHRLMFDTEGV